jgi:Ca2+-binding EF-hand superfamily protein
MSNFAEETLNYINEFRRTPSSIIENLNKIKLNLNRMSKSQKTTDFLKDIDRFIPEVQNLKSLPEFTLNKHLNHAAEKQLERFFEAKQINRDQSDAEVNKVVSAFAEGFNVAYMLINDADDADSVLNRLIFSNYDKNKRNKKGLLDSTCKFIGIAERTFEGENIVIVVITDAANEIKPKREYVNDELKQSFDLFDYNQTGRIDVKEVVNALKGLGYDKTNNTLLNILNELDTKDNEKFGVDWDTFADHVNAKVKNVKGDEKLRKVYDIFLDDPSVETISLNTLRKVCRELGEPIEGAEFKDMIEKAHGNNIELTFKEFLDYMNHKEEPKN